MRLEGVALVLILSACAHGQATRDSSADASTSTVKLTHISNRPTTREEALQVLVTTEQFEDTAIGEGGVPSAEVCAFVILIKEPDAVQVFHSLLDRAHIAGQLYALTGL